MSVDTTTTLASQRKTLGKLRLLIPIGVMGILLVMVLPMPTMVVDLLISLNIILSILILLVLMYILHPGDISAFLSLLLIIPLFHLPLNTASTRLILLDDVSVQDAVKKVIQSPGQFVVSGSYFLGIIVFLFLYLFTKPDETTAHVPALNGIIRTQKSFLLQQWAEGSGGPSRYDRSTYHRPCFQPNDVALRNEL